MTSIPREHGTLKRNASLTERNTLRVAARAEWLAEVRRADALAELVAAPEVRGLPLLVLGGGSNVLFAADFPGVVVSLALPRVAILESDSRVTRLAVEAGAVWDDVVDFTLAQGLAGLENLALIPGLAGAAPIQNIGAYGVEVAEFISSVTAWDTTTHDFAALDAAACGFSYRDSRFRRETDRWIITGLELALPLRRDLRLDYPGIREELAACAVTAPGPRDVAEAVRRLRRRKLPDPAQIGNAGSFFKNPVISAEHCAALVADYPSLPAWPAVLPGERKISAAWLIEQAGFKGYREGDAGVSAQHALVLVNHGAATGAQLLGLARRIVAVVAERFGVQLETEPRIVARDRHAPT